MWVENLLNETLNTEERTKKTLLNSFIKKQKDLNESEQNQLFNAVRNEVKNMSMDYLKKNTTLILQKIYDKKNKLFVDKSIKEYRGATGSQWTTIESQQTTPQSRTWVESDPGEYYKTWKLWSNRIDKRKNSKYYQRCHSDSLIYYQRFHSMRIFLMLGILIVLNVIKVDFLKIKDFIVQKKLLKNLNL